MQKSSADRKGERCTDIDKLQLFILDCGKSKAKREEETVQHVIGADTTIDKVD